MASVSISAAAQSGGSEEAGLPLGPRLPVAAQTLLGWCRTAQLLTAAHSRYGDMFTLRLRPWGSAVVVCNPVLIRDVLSGRGDVFHAGEGNAILATVLGARSLLALDEEEHQHARRRLSPALRLDSAGQFEHTVEEIVSMEVKDWPLLERFPVHPRMRAVTLEVILRTLMGAGDPVRLNALRRVLPGTVPAGQSVMAMWALPALARVGRWRRFTTALARARALLHEEIAERMRDRDLRGGDVLARLLEADELDAAGLSDQLMTLLLVGHDTTATALAWTLERLVRHPEALSRASRGDDEYLDAVIKESLRVRPVVPLVVRTLRQAVRLGEYELPAGVSVMPAIGLLHQDPEQFPEPGRFLPERFLGESNVSSHLWAPFGAGRRRCLGAAFASVQMRVVLRTILDRVRLKAHARPGEPPRSSHITLVPAHGAQIVREGWGDAAIRPARWR